MKAAHQIRSIFLRELLAYFNSPIAYIFLIVFSVLSCGLFMANFFLLAQADLRSFFDVLPLLLCVFISALTMRLWAEDRKGNTFELLLTFPMPSWKVVWGKYLAAFVFYILSLAATLPLVLMVFFVGMPDPGPILGGYLGAVLLGGFYIALGLFISGMCADQIVAFIMAMVVSFLFLAVGWELVAGTIDGWLPGVGSFLGNTLGVKRHFESFTKGIIDFRDVLYFVAAAGIFLTLNTMAVEDRLRRRGRMLFVAASIFGFIIITSAAFLFEDLPIARFDMTRDKVYTVTEAAAGILQSLDAPVTLKLYITPRDKMPTAIKTLEQDIRDRLEELKLKSGGKLKLKVVYMDTEIFDKESEENDSQANRLLKQGIAPISVRSIDKDELGVKLVYASISVAYKNRDEEYIQRVLPGDLQSLEYEVASKIYRMMLDKKPLVALVAPFKEKDVDPGLRNVLAKLGQAAPVSMRDDNYRILEAMLEYENYKVKRIRLTETEPIPKEADALIVVAPEELSERQRWEIARYLWKGGKVIVAAQGFTFDYNQNPKGTAITPKRVQSNINDILGAYGVKVDEMILMDNSSQIINVQSNLSAGPFSYTAPVKAPIQILVNQPTMNQDVSLTGGIPSMFFLWGSALILDEPKINALGLKKTVLMRSSPESWKSMAGGVLTKDQVDPQGKLFQQFPLAVLIEGQFPDATENKPAPAWPSIVEDEAPVASMPSQESVGDDVPAPGQLIVIGCAKMFEEQVIRENGAIPFFTNAVDTLTLGGELINIRNHRIVQRRVRTLSKAEKIFWRGITTAFLPGLIVAVGMMRVWWRRREKKVYVASLKRGKEESAV